MPAQCCKKFWEKIPNDEPVFTLAARDLLAPEVISFWIDRAKKMGVNPEKIQKAVDHWRAFVGFQTAHPERTKIPD